ncbi:MAG: hypothetical protein ACE5H0_04930 [Bacteroidota bacterium]
MATNPPPQVSEFPSDSLEKVAYSSVQEIPTREPNDRNRLGYYVWRWLMEKNGTFEQAIRNSGSRTLIPYEQVIPIVKENLRKRGIEL